MIQKGSPETFQSLYDASYQLASSDPRRALLTAQKALVEAKQDPLSIARAHERISVALRILGEYSGAEEHVRLSRDGYDATGDIRGQAKCCNILGGIYYCQGDYSRTILSYREGLRLSELASDIQYQADALYVIGLAYSHLSSFPESFEYYQRSLNLCEAADLSQTKATVLRCLGTLFLSIGDNDRAISYLELARSVELDRPDVLNIISILSSLGEAYLNLSKLSAALKVQKQALALSRKVKGRIWEAQSLVALATTQVAANLYSDAEHNFRNAAENSRKLQLNPALQAALIGLGRISMLNEQIDAAISILKEASSIQSEALHSEVEIARLLAQCYHRAPNIRKAAEYYAKHDELRQLQQERERKSIVSQMEARIEIGRHERELLEAQARANQLEEEARKRNAELMSLTLQAVEKKKFLESLQSQLLTARDRRIAISRIKEQLRKEDEWLKFELEFSATHGDFIAALGRKHPAITVAQARICALLRLQLPTKVIASTLSLSGRTVEWHRNEIRKALGLSPGADLTKYLTGI